MTKVNNGPDRDLGVWQGKLSGSRYHRRIHNRRLQFDGNPVGWLDDPSTGIDELMSNWRPADTTAKREAIRAGWREVDGKWVKDERGHLDYCGKCSSGYHCNQWHCPERFQVGAKRRGEWPQDEPQAVEPAPKSTKAPTAYRAAKAALREPCDEARQQGREEAARRQPPCVLARLQAASGHGAIQADQGEMVLMALLGATVEEAKRRGLDLSAVAHKLADVATSADGKPC